MKKLRKQLLLLAALLVLTLTGCEAQDLLSTERALPIRHRRPFQFLMFRSFPVNRMSF